MTNPEKAKRIVIIPSISHAHGDIAMKESGPHDLKIKIIAKRKKKKKLTYFVKPELLMKNDDTYLFPFLYNADGSPWIDAIHYLYHLTEEVDFSDRSPSHLRDKAVLLLDYKIWTEEEGRDLMAFESTRASGRTSYAYFAFLKDSGLSAGSLNIRTGVVYDFYKYLAKRPGVNLDLRRVDQTELVTLRYTHSDGSQGCKLVTSRSQTLKKPKPGPVKIGYISDGGEKLRPLTPDEFDMLTEAVFTKLATDEKIMFELGWETGARRQTILTLRMKHIDLFNDQHLIKEGQNINTYRLSVGPLRSYLKSADHPVYTELDRHTGIDTKFNNPGNIYIPKNVAERIKIYAHSENAKKRRDKFIKKRQENGKVGLNERDMYLFLSNEGNPHYMAKNDPEYRATLDPPRGRNLTNTVDRLKKKYLPTA